MQYFHAVPLACVIASWNLEDLVSPMLDLATPETTTAEKLAPPPEVRVVTETVAERGSTLKGFLNLWNHRHLVALMVQRDFQGRYKGSLLGALWPLLNPAGHMVIYTFLFSVVLQVRFNTNGGTGDFALYLMSGFLPWTAMSEAVSHATTKILELPNLVKRCVFPLETLPLIVAISSFLTGAIAVALLIVFAAFRQGGISGTVCLIPLILVPHFLFTCGLSWLLASLGVFIRDCRHFISLGLSAWMYMTPILYPPERMPEHLKFLLYLNPMAGIITDYRHVILENKMPNWEWYGIYTALSVVVCYLGFSFFYKTKHGFADIV